MSATSSLNDSPAPRVPPFPENEPLDKERGERHLQLPRLREQHFSLFEFRVLSQQPGSWQTCPLQRTHTHPQTTVSSCRLVLPKRHPPFTKTNKRAGHGAQLWTGQPSRERSVRDIFLSPLGRVCGNSLAALSPTCHTLWPKVDLLQISLCQEICSVQCRNRGFNVVAHALWSFFL